MGVKKNDSKKRIFEFVLLCPLLVAPVFFDLKSEIAVQPDPSGNNERNEQCSMFLIAGN